MQRIAVTLWLLTACGLTTAAADAPGKLLFRDTFASTEIKNNVTFTRPELPADSKTAPPGGRVTGPVTLGTEGAKLSGLSQIRYEPVTNLLDPSGGELEFRVKLHFDPLESNERTRTVLRNQIFASLWDTTRGYSQVSVYNAGRDSYAVCVMNAERNIVFHKRFAAVWRPGEWHHLKLTWGRELALWCDGEKKTSGPFTGLFGPVTFDPATTVLYTGTQIGYSNMESEFTLADLTIRGPAGDQVARRPRLTLPLLSGKPTLDGRLDDPFWREACRVQGFVHYTTDELAALQPVLLTAYTTAGLWLAMEVNLPPGTAPRAVLTALDSPIYSEDTVEFFLQPEGLPATDLFQFMVSAAGTRFDVKHTAGKADVGGYNPDWPCAASGGPGRWSAEAFIPFQALGLSAPPAAGSLWKGNFCIDSSAGLGSAMTWAQVAKTFTDPVYFGELLFSGNTRTVRQESFRGFDTGEPLVTYNLVGEFQPIITVTGELTDSAGTNLFRNSLRLRDTKSIDLQPPTLTTGKYLMTLEGVDENGQVALFQGFRFQTAKAFDIAVSKYPYAGYALFKANTKGIREPVQKIVCAITGPDGEPAGELPIMVGKNGSGDVRFPIRNLPAGVYTVTATVQGADGKTLESAKRTFELFPLPAWWGNNLGIDHSVPPPFTAVKATDAGWSVWGRDCTFAGSIFPKQIRNQGVDMFATPPSLRLKADGKTTDLATMTAAAGDVFPDAVTLTAQQTIGTLAVTVKTTVEFDGLIRCDLTLTPTAGPAKVEAFVLEIPLTRAIGQFLMTSNGGSSSIQPLKTEVASPFLPYIWFGNGDMGLAWCADRDPYWSTDPKRALVVTPGTDQAVLHVNFISNPVSLDAPATYAFGIMASPVRPVPANDPFALPSFSAGGNISFCEFLTYPVPDALKAGAGTLEFWVKRSEAKPWANTSLFRLGGKKSFVAAYFMTPTRPDELTVFGGAKGQEVLLKTTLSPATGRFVHLALVWNGDALRCYADGKLAGRGSPAAAATLLAALKDEGATIKLGCVDDTYSYTGIVLDEVRVSQTARYQGDTHPVPEAAFAADPDTLILDHFEDAFTPDGQDAWTAAGGVPSIGSKFTAGKFAQGLLLQVAPPRPGLDIVKEMVENNVCTHWGWQPEMVSCYGQPVLLDESKLIPGLRESLQEWKKRGIPNLPYMAFPAISSTSGLIERYGDEWQTLPVSTMQWQFGNSPPNYYFLLSCQGARAYADYFAAAVPWAMKDVGFDGFYSDGVTSITACQNEAHGCGYRDRDGNLHSTFPFFATRETLKRMYRLVKACDPKGLVANHCSFNLMLPIASFSDVVYTGEHEDYENPLTARLRFSSKPWGIYITLLGTSEHVYAPLHAMAPLLSGTSTWGSGIVGRNDWGRKDAAIRKAYRDFDTRTATWVPWWEGEKGPCRANDPKVRVSYYCHPGKGVLLLAGNFNPENKTPAIRLDLAKCGLAGRPLKAWNVLTGVPVPIAADGQFAPLIRGKSFVLLRIESTQ